MTLLENIHSPADVKALDRSVLPDLADELRATIVDVVSRTGGHLASSLGVVELAIAIHYVFDAPHDRIIWDVGHQSYAHKLLTGRYETFQTLRRHGGLSGFVRAGEHPCDAFSTGHSGTSISAALGIACANSLKHEASKTIAVIGDGSLTAGLAYEGLNQAGHIKKDMVVILNENDMSISPNVGALSSFLSRTLSSKYLQDLRKDFKDFLKSLSKVGVDIYNFAKRSEDSFKTFITPGMLFEAFNFDYFGPIDGHRLDHLVDILNNIKQLNSPVLLHVRTVKGRGYPPAEANPVYFHGVGSFEVQTGASIPDKCKIPTYTKVFGETMVELAGRRDDIVAVTAAMPEGTGLARFSELYPDRFFDVGIAEQHGVTFAAGIASRGMKPVVAIYSTFLQRAYDQILHDVCLDGLPVVFAVDRGGIVGEDGPTHHGNFDLSFLRSLPNMVVMSPKDENELRRMLLLAITHPGPAAVRYPRGKGIGVDLDPEITPLPMGKAEILGDGDDIVLLAIGACATTALQARSVLETHGIRASVVNARFVKPLDRELITALARRVPRIVTIEENVLQGGFGSAVLECLCDAGVTNFKIKRLGIPDRFVEHGAQQILRRKYGLDTETIVQTALDLVRNGA